MKLYALSDLHLGYEINRRALLEVESHKSDWLILAGDVGETCEQLRFAFEVLAPRFKQLVWVPGNHELWTVPSKQESERGHFKYTKLIDLCRAYDVITPEDPYPVVSVNGQATRIAPLFLLYDYSFRPDDVPLAKAISWAEQAGVVCTDEYMLHADPYSNRAEWCHARCAEAEMRLDACNDGLPTVLVNHFPLRRDLAHLPSMPQFSLWCGTRKTEDWHLRFNAAAVVSGHLHRRSTAYRDDVRFEEVSLGYPKQWSGYVEINDCIREILPGPTERDPGNLVHLKSRRLLDEKPADYRMRRM